MYMTDPFRLPVENFDAFVDLVEKLKDPTFRAADLPRPRTHEATAEIGWLCAQDDEIDAVATFVAKTIRDAAAAFDPVPYRMSTLRAWVNDDGRSRLLHVAINAMELRAPDDDDDGGDD